MIAGGGCIKVDQEQSPAASAISTLTIALSLAIWADDGYLPLNASFVKHQTAY